MVTTKAAVRHIADMFRAAYATEPCPYSSLYEFALFHTVGGDNVTLLSQCPANPPRSLTEPPSSLCSTYRPFLPIVAFNGENQMLTESKQRELVLGVFERNATTFLHTQTARQIQQHIEENYGHRVPVAAIEKYKEEFLSRKTDLTFVSMN